MRPIDCAELYVDGRRCDQPPSESATPLIVDAG